ncbi:unnamed protein product [Didymodactylos carnosus]|uniref:Uncharacterized protein n=1 Tax=Didymodactylos carnosus TaxID=1234261 RepID=A0A813PP45_9BILA|nr:unnamed protein product [Didymodactylos carnosus]CAF0819744.1 unnamed protein product [Didymodactylos carnosus]CAF3538373.1 unnamed protein product [Didymodactylos carnosus]CAF3603919.1 unnamed protein product [Didymodactylos carnosus]
MFNIFIFYMILINNDLNGNKITLFQITPGIPIVTRQLYSKLKLPRIIVCKPFDQNCSRLIHQLLECENIIMNDPGFSSQQYVHNINIHRQMITEMERCFDDEINPNPLSTEKKFDFSPL